ncbi:MAG TPA: hypothetical protein DC056_00080, partial [Dehalococcoidia bacterium]|nr:hypothetical protein [Dehalococcoidia bacterium]
MCQQFLLLPFVSNILSGAFSDSQHLSVMDEQKSEMHSSRGLGVRGNAYGETAILTRASAEGIIAPGHENEPDWDDNDSHLRRRSNEV